MNKLQCAFWLKTTGATEGGIDACCVGLHLYIDKCNQRVVGKMHANDDITDSEGCKMIRTLSCSELEQVLFCMSRAALSERSL